MDGKDREGGTDGEEGTGREGGHVAYHSGGWRWRAPGAQQSRRTTVQAEGRRPLNKEDPSSKKERKASSRQDTETCRGCLDSHTFAKEHMELRIWKSTGNSSTEKTVRPFFYIIIQHATKHSPNDDDCGRFVALGEGNTAVSRSPLRLLLRGTCSVLWVSWGPPGHARGRTSKT